MLWKEIFGTQTVSPSLYDAQHNAVLARAQAFGSQSHSNNLGQLRPRLTQKRVQACQCNGIHYMQCFLVQLEKIRDWEDTGAV